MSKEKQIEEIFNIIINRMLHVKTGGYIPMRVFVEITQDILGAGYRKQKEGEWKQVCGDLGWVEMECSVCRYTDVFNDDSGLHKFCPNCGAKMKGE